MQKRGQAAIEFLTTYGWAILLLIVAVAAIVGLGVFNPQTPNICNVDIPFICTDVVFREGGFEATLTTNNIVSGSVVANEVVINNIKCNNVRIKGKPAGDLSLINGINKIVCYNNVSLIKEKDKVKVNLNLTYKASDASLPHKVTSSMNGRVEKSSYINNFDSSAVLSMDFDNDNTNTVVDNSYYGNNGGFPPLISGPTLQTSNCASGKCYSFDGIDDYINISNGSIMNFNNNADFTLEVWLRTNDNTVGKRILIKRDISSVFDLYMADAGNGRVSLYIATTSTIKLYSEIISSSITDNQWHHIVAVVSGSTGTVRGYRDGVLQLTLPLIVAGNPQNNANVFIGSYPSGGLSFNGRLDNIRVYNRALSTAEVVQHYQNR